MTATPSPSGQVSSNAPHTAMAHHKSARAVTGRRAWACSRPARSKLANTHHISVEVAGIGANRSELCTAVRVELCTANRAELCAAKRNSHKGTSTWKKRTSRFVSASLRRPRRNLIASNAKTHEPPIDTIDTKSLILYIATLPIRELPRGLSCDSVIHLRLSTGCRYSCYKPSSR